MIRLIFKDSKANGYATVNYSSNNETEVIKEVTEVEINNLLAEILEPDETWEDKFMYLSLDTSKNIYCDTERYNSTPVE